MKKSIQSFGEWGLKAQELNVIFAGGGGTGSGSGSGSGTGKGGNDNAALPAA